MSEAKGQNVAYVRVSTIEQNEERQLEILKPYGIDRFFVEKISGKNMERPQLQEMLLYIREGDAVYVSEFSRLGRSTEDLLKIVRMIESKGARFVSVKESMDTSTPAGRLQMTMLAAIAEYERAIILERQREGIEIAKRKGKYKGRKKIVVPNFGEYYDRYMRREISKSGIAKELNVNRETVDRIMRDYLAELERKKGAG